MMRPAACIPDKRLIPYLPGEITQHQHIDRTVCAGIPSSKPVALADRKGAKRCPRQLRLSTQGPAGSG